MPTRLNTNRGLSWWAPICVVAFSAFAVFFTLLQYEGTDANLPTSTSQVLDKGPDSGATTCRDIPVVCAHRGSAPELGIPFAHPEAIRKLWQEKRRRTKLQMILYDTPASSDILCSSCAGIVVPPSKRGIKTIRQDVGDRSIEELRQAGATVDKFPPLEDMVQQFAEQLRSSGMLAEQGKKLTIETRHSWPLLAIDLKDGAMNEATVARFARLAVDLGIEHHVSMWFRDERDPLVHIARREAPNMLVGVVVPDRVVLPDGTVQSVVPEVTEVMKTTFDLLGPSIKLPPTWFRSAHNQGMMTMSWTIDEEPQMVKSVQDHVHLAITDYPLQFRSVVAEQVATATTAC